MSTTGVAEGGEFRLEMLEMIREHAWERLEASGEADALRHRHAAYFLAWVKQAGEPLYGPAQGDWAARLEHDHANLRAILQALLDQGEVETALRLGADLSRFWILRDHISEGRRWLDAALVRSRAGAGAEEVRGKALMVAGHLAAIQGDSAAAIPPLEESVALAIRWEDKGHLAFALTFLAMAVAREDVGRAAALWQEGLALRRKIGDTYGIAQSLMNLGFVAAREGDFRQAIRIWEESLALRRVIGDRFGIAMLFKALGFVALQHGEHTRARRLLQEGLVLFREAGSKVQMADCLVIASMLAADRKRPEQMASYLGAAHALLDATGASLDSIFHFGAIMDPLYYREYERSLATARSQLGTESFASACAAGQARPPEQTIEEALAEGD